jgi:hypothetical protein
MSPSEARIAASRATTGSIDSRAIVVRRRWPARPD